MGHDVANSREPEHPAFPHALPERGQRPVVRRLDEHDRHVLEAFLDADPGYGLFLRGNLTLYHLRNNVLRYWGLFEHGQLRAAAMLIAQRAALYAPRGVDVRPLARHVMREGVEFTMGRSDMVDVLLAASDTVRVDLREEHYLAELALRTAQLPPITAPAGAFVRRATTADLGGLTRLYTGAAGFEHISTEQIRRTMIGRVRSMRTYVAEYDNRLVAAASTSAETPLAAMIGGVWTEPEMRNRGYSTAVVTALSRELLDEGRRPFLFYLIHNEPAAHVYAHIGYRPVGRWSVAYLSQLSPA